MAEKRYVAVQIGNLTHCITSEQYDPKLHPDNKHNYVLSDCGQRQWGSLCRGAMVTCMQCIAKWAKQRKR